MAFIDTHTHIYLSKIEEERAILLQRCLEHNITKLFLPNIDIESIEDVKSLSETYPNNCFPMMGLHPCSVKADYKNILEIIYNELQNGHYYGIGEVGLDFYWDKTFFNEQCESFNIQAQWGIEKHLPVIIHARKSMQEILGIIKNINSNQLFGIMHCFSGTYQQALESITLGFKIGIGGTITYKKNDMRNWIHKIPLEHIVLETDSPYLAPVPFRGKTNESSYIIYVAQELAKIYNVDLQIIETKTTENALKVFGV